MSKKIIITGAAGFIGSRLAEICVKNGYEVTAFDKYNSFNNFGWLENSKYKQYIKFSHGDVRDLDTVMSKFKKNNIVLHLAALVGIPYSYEAPLSYIKTNIEGTYNVLEASRNYNFDQILITSTSEVYGSAQKIPISEDHPLVGQSPYSASKIAADQIAMSYYKSFGSPVKIVRPFNTFGPRQSLRAIIPQIILQLQNDKKKIYFGNITPTRDLTFVDDTCEGFLQIMKRKAFFGTVTNIGSKNEISVKNLIIKISKLMNINKNIVFDKNRVRPKKSEVDRLVCDNFKIVKNSNWKPKFTLDQGLFKTIEWMSNNNKNIKNEYVI